MARRSVSRQVQQKHLQVDMSKCADGATVTSGGAEQYASDALMTLQTRLNDAKSSMDIYYLASKTDVALAKSWSYFQNIIDLYKPMRREIARRYGAEIVTNAWMKYYEIYTQYELIPTESQGRKFIAFFNAELPGAALCAFNHYMRTMRPNMQFDWYASSLAPPPSQGDADADNSDVLGDTYGLYAQHKSHWLMDLDAAPTDRRRNDGDATKIENILDWAARIGPDSEVGGVNMYSHDAGIDVSGQTAEGLGFIHQEMMNAKIHLGCALAGFMCLRPGGVFVAKQYTFFNTLTWNLLIIYARLFDEWHLCKPLTSRPYNSEIYLVGKGFRGLDAETRRLLMDRLTNWDTTPLIPSNNVPRQCLAEIERFGRIVFGQQELMIRENMTLFDRYRRRLGQLAAGLSAQGEARIKEWLQTYPVRPIAPADLLLRKSGLVSRRPNSVKSGKFCVTPGKTGKI